MISFDEVEYTRIGVPNPPPAATPLVLADGRSIPVPNYPDAIDPAGLMGVQTITHMAFIEGNLFVSGLSNEEFASKMRVIPYPFRTANEGTSVEIYHGSHGQLETFSPVFTFVPYEIDGEPSIVASYLCTPLVKFPVSALEPGGKIQGTTIAEFGNRNRPIDMIVYEKDGRDYLLLSNNQRGVMKVPTEPFAEAAPITDYVPDTDGVPFETIETMAGVRQLDLLDASHAMLLLENPGGGFEPRSGRPAVRAAGFPRPMPYTARAAVVLAAALALSPACSQPSGQQPDPAGGDPRIRLSAAPSGALAVVVEGLPAEVLARLEHDSPTREAWQALLRVQVARADGASDELPPVLGDYAVRDGALRFTPRFPVRPGSALRRRLRSVVPSVDAPGLRAAPHPDHD